MQKPRFRRFSRLGRSLRALFALRVPRFARAWPAAVPLVIERYHCDAPARPRTLLVCLPGIGDVAADYEARGFIAALRQHGFDLDVTTVDAHYGYYADRSLLRRLRQDVIGPARAAGYEKIWLLGISLGGLGALLYAQAHPEEVQGLVLLAPFLGTPRIVEQVRKAGGLAHWRAPRQGPHDLEQTLWQWLKGYTKGTARPPLHLAFGERDRFAAAHRMLAAALPQGQVLVLPGRHGWRTWKRLWRALLDRRLQGL